MRFEPTRAAMLRLPVGVGWDQVSEHYQAVLADDWTIGEPEPAPALTLGAHVRLWQRGARHFAVALIDEVLEDAPGSFRILLVMSEPDE